MRFNYSLPFSTQLLYNKQIIKKGAKNIFTGFINIVMNIHCNSNIYFGANKLNYSPKVLKRNDKTGEYKAEKVSMVEIDLDNPNDIKVMKELGEKWDNYNLMENMADEAENFANGEDLSDGYRFFAVTAQKEGFENLNPEDILSFCEVESFEDIGNAHIEYIQTNAESANMHSPKYKRCGSAMLDGLKYYYSYIHLNSLTSAVKFYERNRFRPISKVNKYHMYWEKGR